MESAKSISTQVRDLFKLTQENNRNDIFLNFLFSDNTHKEGYQSPDSWRFQAEILTFILYIFCPNEKVLGRLLSPLSNKGISQPAVSKRLHRAIEIIAEKYGCPAQALHQELTDVKHRIITEKMIKEMRSKNEGI